VAAAVMTSLQELALTINTEPPIADLFDTAYLRSRVQHLSLSASMLNTFLDCPIKFYFSSLLRVPQAKNDSMQFGTAVHHALQKLFNDMRETGQFASEQFLLDEFRYHLRLNRDAFTEKQFKNRMEYGELILPEYYRHYVNGWNKVVITEYPIREVNWKNIPLNGKLDKLEFDGNNVNVVDYKTGQIKWAKEKLKSPSEKLPLGGDYWRQMVFYRILLEQQRLKPWHMVSGEFDFIEKNPETGKFEKIKLPISESDVAFVKAQIEDVYEKIQGLAFTEGCGKEDCYYCNLLKS
jgi:DNA helicase-2/ATP-dependent DNA helicase PcrA